MLLTTPRLPLRCEIASDSPAQFVQVFEIGISLVAPTPTRNPLTVAPGPIKAVES